MRSIIAVYAGLFLIFLPVPFILSPVVTLAALTTLVYTLIVGAPVIGVGFMVIDVMRRVR